MTANAAPAPGAVLITVDDDGTARLQWPGQGRTAQLQTGREYRLTYRYAGQGFDRQAQMSYLGADRDRIHLQFNARPAAGTQAMPASVLITVEDIGPSLGRDHTSRYLNWDSRKPRPEVRRG